MQPQNLYAVPFLKFLYHHSIIKKLFPIYVFRTKNIRSPSQKRMSSDWKTYVLRLEDIKQRLPKTDSYFEIKL